MKNDRNIDTYTENYNLTHKILSIMIILLLLSAHFLLFGCDDAKSRARKIVSLRNERRVLVDELYKEYGGSDLARAVTEDIKKQQVAQGRNQDAAATVNELTRNVDQNLFEIRVREIGQGEKPLFMTEKAREFFSRQDVIKKMSESI